MADKAGDIVDSKSFMEKAEPTLEQNLAKGFAYCMMMVFKEMDRQSASGVIAAFASSASLDLGSDGSYKIIIECEPGTKHAPDCPNSAPPLDITGGGSKHKGH